MAQIFLVNGILSQASTEHVSTVFQQKRVAMGILYLFQGRGKKSLIRICKEQLWM